MADARVIVEQVEEDLEPLLPRFFENTRQEARELRAALERGDRQTVRRLGHSLKGSGLGYGFRGLGDIGRRIEQAMVAGEAEERVLPVLDELDDYLGRVKVRFVPVGN